VPPNDGLQLRRAISIRAELKGYLRSELPRRQLQGFVGRRVRRNALPLLMDGFLPTVIAQSIFDYDAVQTFPGLLPSPSIFCRRRVRLNVLCSCHRRKDWIAVRASRRRYFP